MMGGISLKTKPRVKHTYSWHDKPIALWTLNKQKYFYVQKFSFSVPLNQHLNTIRTRCLGRSNLVMAHLTNFGVKGTLCNSRIVLEGKAGKKMSMSSRLGLLKMVLRNNLDLFNAEDKTSKPLNRGGSYCKVTFVQNTIDISPKFTKA